MKRVMNGLKGLIVLALMFFLMATSDDPYSGPLQPAEDSRNISLAPMSTR